MRIRLLRKSFAERNAVVIGIIGSAALVLALLMALSLQSLPFFNSGTSYSAMFREAGGLTSGDDVVVSGVSVGTVGSVTLDHATVRVQFSITDSHVHLGDLTTAAISTETVLGKRGLRLTPDGTGTLAPGATIPLSRTTPPYDLTDALSGLTTTTAAIQTDQLARALRMLTSTFRDTPSSVRATIRGVGAVARTIASRDAELGSLLASSRNVTGILAQRNQQITTLLGDGAQLLAVVNARRATVTSLLIETTQLSQQLRGLVADNRATLGPALTSLSHVADILIRNKQNLDMILDRAAPFAASLGESVSSGAFFQAYVQNLTRPVDLLGLDLSKLNGIGTSGRPGSPGVPTPSGVPTSLPTPTLPVPSVPVPTLPGTRR